MRYFQKLADDIFTVPVMAALARNAHLWNQNTLRTQHEGTPHTMVDDIWLRFNEHNGVDGDVNKLIDIVHGHESVNYPAMWLLPQVRPLIFGLMNLVEGERLGRCLITRLPPGANIAPHVDSGEHAAYYDRFHIVLQSNPGVMFRTGDERVNMLTGEMWWFDNSVEHEVINDSNEDRIHLVVDIRTSR